MFLSIAIHKDDHSVYGVTVPDLPGCFSSGETIAQAIANATEAAYFHIEGLIEDGQFDTVRASSIEELQANPDYSGAVWALIDLDMSRVSQQQTRFNVSWPQYLLTRVDEYAAAHHETRSGFLAKAAQHMLDRQTA